MRPEIAGIGLMALAIVGVFFCGLYSLRQQTRLKLAELERGRQGGEHQQQHEETLARLDRLEQRMANLETLAIEHEKSRPFERLR